MGYSNVLPPVSPDALEEKRRNWLLRTRFGSPWLSKSLKGKIYPGLHVRGRTVLCCHKLFTSESDAELGFLPVLSKANHFSRLPAIPASEIQSTQRHHLADLSRTMMHESRIGHSLDDFHLNKSTIPMCATGPEHEERNSEICHLRRPSSYGDDIRSPRTAPEFLGHRRWSDSERKDLLEDSVQNLSTGLYVGHKRGKETIAKYKEEFLGTQKVKEAVKHVNNLRPMPGKLPSFVTMKMPMPKSDLISHISSPRELDSNRYPSSPTKEYEKFVELQHMTETNRNNPVKRGRTEARRIVNNGNITKIRKQSMLVPSGDSSNSTTTNSAAVNRTSSNSNTKTSSLTKLPQRRSSRTLSRDVSKLRKSDVAMKSRKSISKPESPPRPSEEEMQELEELPVIRKFLKMPPSRPKVICFDYPGVDLTHLDVKRAIEKVIPDAFETGKVVSLQFENVNVKLATGGLNNRWYIEMRDFTTRNLLIKKGLSPEVSNKSTSCTELTQKPSSEAGTSGEAEQRPPQIEYPKSVQVKLYDTLSMEEYKLYLRRTAAEEKLQNVILLCAGRGDKLLSTML